MLNDGSLPILSDVEYYFLPGEHQVDNIVGIVRAFNFSLIGFGLPPAKLLCLSQSYVGVLYSHNVTIRNLVFDQCSGIFVSSLQVVGALYFFESSYCIVEHVNFMVTGLLGLICLTLT